MLKLLYSLQTEIHASLTAIISDYALSHNGLGLLVVLPLGVLFGAVHALTPGHSKSVLAAYVISAGINPLKALFTSIVLSFTHISSAILLAVITNTLVTKTIVGAGRAPALEWTSRIILIGIGVWLIARAIYARPHLHGESLGAGVIAGLIPCPLTMFVMTLAISRNAPEAGLAFAFAMFIGVAATLGAVAVIAAFARNFLTQLLAKQKIAIAHLARVFDATAGVALTLIAISELSR